MTIAATAASLTLSGFARAEEASQIDQTSNVEVVSTDSDQVQVSNEQSSTVAVGSSDGSDSQTTETASTTTEIGATIDDPALSDRETAPQADNKPALAQSDQSPSQVSTAKTSDSSTPAASAQSKGTSREFFVQDSNAFIQPSISSEAPIAPAASPSPNAPSQPLPASGAVGQLNALLAQTLLPVLRDLLQSGEGLLTALAGSPLASLVLLVILLSVATQSFVSWLRRSGYSHAARSDASVPLFSFATPQKMSLAWAVSPNRSSSFYGVRHQNLIERY